MVDTTFPLDATTERRSAVQQAEFHIASMIDLRRVKPGERLPSSAELASQIGVSRPAVLQALKILGAQGRVIVRPGRGGCWVAGHDPDNLESRVARAWERRDTIVQMAHLREMLEPGAARLVAERGMAPDLMAEARELARRIRESDESEREQQRAWDTALHLLVARATGMPVIESFVALCRREVAAAFDVMTWTEDRKNTYAGEHDALLDAIERRDPEAAARAAHTHVSTTTTLLAAILGGPTRSLGESLRKVTEQQSVRLPGLEVLDQVVDAVDGGSNREGYLA
jgi:DNA-binding FadR family transcriptional regulator